MHQHDILALEHESIEENTALRSKNVMEEQFLFAQATSFLKFLQQKIEIKLGMQQKEMKYFL
jgi:hypothetical protein